MTASEGLQTGPKGSDSIEIGAVAEALESPATDAHGVGDDLRAALLPWVVSRVLVVGALLFSRRVFDDVGRLPRPLQLGQGLFSWDAAFYRAIAEHGYRAVGRESLRFFPLVPMLARGIGWALPGGEATALIVVVNISAFACFATLHRLTRRETGDVSTARLAVWFAALFPVASVLVMGYAEATAMLLGVLVFLMLRSRRFGWAMFFGVLAGLCRPVGVLLVIPAAIEAARDWRTSGARERWARVGAVAGPVVGVVLFLAWVGAQFDDPWLPMSEQNKATLRGGFQDPFSRSFDAVRDALDHHFGGGLHLLAAVVFVALLVVIARRLPASYTWYCAATIVVGLSAHNLDSFERYAMSTFPFAMALGIVFVRREQWTRAALGLAGASLFAYAMVNFLGLAGP
jgi:hypothetical protein